MLRLAPFFAISAIITPLIIWFVAHGSGEVNRDATFLERLLGAGTVPWFYLSKALLPVHLAFVYPMWKIGIGDVHWWIPLAAAGCVTWLLWQFRKSTVDRALLFAWAYFCIALLPVIGFADPGYMRYSLVADHYQHLALIGIAAALAAAWHYWRSGVKRRADLWPNLTLGALLCGLGYLACCQSALYAKAETLYRASLERNPNCSIMQNGLGIRLLNSGNASEAMNLFEKALALDPSNAQAHCNLGLALASQQRIDDALREYQRAGA